MRRETKMSNGRISRSTLRSMITTELQNFVPVGQLCHVKAQSKSKGSNLATVCRSELAVAIGMVKQSEELGFAPGQSVLNR